MSIGIYRLGRESSVERWLKRRALKETDMSESENVTKWMVVRVHADGTRSDYEDFGSEGEANNWASYYEENLQLEPFMTYEVEKREGK